MPKRALIERRPWLLASVAAAVLFLALQSSPLPGIYLLLLEIAPFALLAAYALLRHKGRDTRLLAAMMALEGAGWALDWIYPTIGINALLLGFLAGLCLFLAHRMPVPDPDRKVAAVAMLLGTPILCWIAGTFGLVFFGVALGGMAASAWISTFAWQRVGVGALLIVVGTVLALAGAGGGSLVAAMVEWGLFYVGNLVLATGITGELRLRETR